MPQRDHLVHDTRTTIAPPEDAWADAGVSQALFEQSPFSTVIYDAAGHLLAVNPAFRALWGVGAETAPPNYSVLTDPELDRQGMLVFIRDAFAGNTVVTPPLRYDISRVSATGTGRRIWTQAHLFPVRGPAGEVTHVVLVHVDLTARVETEESLRASEERFRGAQEASPDAFAVFQSVRDETGSIVDFIWEYANPAALRVQGLPLHELRGQRMHAPNPRTFDSGVFAGCVRAAETGEPFETEMRYRHEWIDTWFHITAVKLDDGIAVTFSDVTARYRSQERARGLLALAAGLSGASTPEEVADVVFREGLSAVGADGGSLGLVREGPGDERRVDMVRTRGYGPDAEARYQHFDVVAGRPLSDAILSQRPVLIGTRDEWDERYPLQFEMNIAPLGFEAYAALPIILGDRPVAAVSFSFRGRRTFDDDTRTFLETIGRLCTQALERARAFDAERAARAEAERANHAKMEFLATMSHELRTPLNAIGGYAELLEMGVRGPVTPAQRNDLERIQHSQRHLLTLINDVLNFAKLEAGKIDVHMGPVAMGATLAALEPLLAPQLRARQLTYDCIGCDPNLRVTADGDKVRQIMLNLLSNAIKFTPEGGRITVFSEEESDRVLVAVRDTGVGIAAVDVDRIFDSFVQLERRLNNVVEGTGLGLAISRDLARAMGGDITVESTPAMGSTFILSLRKHAEPPADSPADGSPVAAGARR